MVLALLLGLPRKDLAVDSSGNIIEIPIGSGAIDGCGTQCYIPKWIDSTQYLTQLYTKILLTILV